MELPADVLMIIKEFSKPVTRVDWREGCFIKRMFKCKCCWKRMIKNCDLKIVDYELEINNLIYSYFILHNVISFP